MTLWTAVTESDGVTAIGWLVRSIAVNAWSSATTNKRACFALPDAFRLDLFSGAPFNVPPSERVPHADAHVSRSAPAGRAVGPGVFPTTAGSAGRVSNAGRQGRDPLCRQSKERAPTSGRLPRG